MKIIEINFNIVYMFVLNEFINMRPFLNYNIDIIPLLISLDILILIITAVIRKQYILFHLAEIIFFLSLIVIFVLSQKNNDDREDKFQMIFYNMILIFSVIWVLGVLLLNRVQTEINNQDFFYALLLITFLITIIIHIMISLKEIISQKLITNVTPLIWIIVGSSLLITTWYLAPAEDISELLANITRLF